jgi:hypothetical protein
VSIPVLGTLCIGAAFRMNAGETFYAMGFDSPRAFQVTHPMTDER